MAESSYFITLTSAFRAPDVKNNVTFTPGAVGFSYNSPGIAFHLLQTSKNRYTVRAIYAGKFEEYVYHSQREAVDFTIKLLNLDRAGAFRARKSS
jgi:hypothetical protein